MATVNYYVNPTTGNDAWDGTSPTFVSGTTGPKKHVSAMIAALMYSITDEVIINLAGTLASPEIFLEPTGMLSLAGLRFQGDGASLTIRPLIWNQPNYEGGGDPYGGSGAWNPADGNKPCVLPRVEISGTNQPINITGVTIAGLYTQTAGIKVDFGAELWLNYCAVGTFVNGAHVVGGVLGLVNCAFTRNWTGVLAENNAQVFCFGDNYIHNSLLEYTVIIDSVEQRYSQVVRKRKNAVSITLTQGDGHASCSSYRSTVYVPVDDSIISSRRRLHKETRGNVELYATKRRPGANEVRSWFGFHGVHRRPGTDDDYDGR